MRAKEVVPKPWETRRVLYFLFFIPNERKYFYLSNVSKWWPSGTVGENLVKLQQVEFSNGGETFTAEYIMHSDKEKDVEGEAKKLNRKLLDNSSERLNSSFFNTSAEATQSRAQSRSRSNESDSNESDSDESSPSPTRRPPKPRQVTGPGSAGTTESNLVLEGGFLRLCSLVSANNQLQRRQLKQLVKIRKGISRGISRLSSVTEEIPTEPMEPVMFGNTDLTKLGKRNIEPSRFAVLVARTVFSDEEMKGKSLFPKRVTSKPSLSPTRSDLIARTLKSRFHLNDDSEGLQEAVNAVNQLTADVSRGRRLNPHRR